jgi:hypothetical protein
VPRQFPGLSNALLKNYTFSPEDVAVLATAYQAALEEMKVTDRKSPAAELLAKRILELAHKGERNLDRLREFATEGL